MTKIKLKTINQYFLLVFIFLSTGCNFFGTKKDTATAQSNGSLANGVTILGTWTVSYASTNATNNPTDLYTESFSFDSTSSFRLEMKDPHQGGITCIAVGVYKIINNDLMLFVNSINNSMCGFSAQYHFGNIFSDDYVLKMTDLDSNIETTYFRSMNPSTQSLYGIWNFHSQGSDQNGDGGIDWIFFDSSGYFLLQTKFSGQMYIMQGFFSINSSNAVTMVFFTDRPDVPDNSAMMFDQYVTSGTQLALSYSNGNGGFGSYTGDRL